jgi:uncharacterized protein
MTVFLDTNIFVYAAGKEGPHKAPCLKILREVADGTLSAVTNVEVIQELLHLFSRRNRRADGVALCRRVLALIPEPLPVERRTVELLCQLAEKYPDKGTRDLLHLASMVAAGIQQIVTVDQDFDHLDEVERVVPG